MLTYWSGSTSRPRRMSNRAPHLWKLLDVITGEDDLKAQPTMRQARFD